ncbi:hypothetical protein AMK68_02075 [candidate division KD3-62 bacterium DG_56]|uniref:Uncharacterized protein n=1 Tax=candidate division KD3-62 bacterium DG_56 TaxID=1704032 RepID=A0A0S7XP04_9BACT|nr:MAG: hypothetical protein AMK68_02075 [candidate division KD3-62 bacterium DG_56]
MAEVHKPRLGEVLLDSGMITERFLDHCLEIQRRSGSFKQIGRIMVDELDYLVEKLAATAAIEQMATAGERTVR